LFSDIFASNCQWFNWDWRHHQLAADRWAYSRCNSGRRLSAQSSVLLTEYSCIQNMAKAIIIFIDTPDFQ
ncbi:MAG: hypothetical protein NWF01_12575, partial [Candidatus Bathyarchaeota archaeon]|nr:hypothetical protein [Candidatus Bathyarchaeota archaeon]